VLHWGRGVDWIAWVAGHGEKAGPKGREKAVDRA
jgi:hypothetical protein